MWTWVSVEWEHAVVDVGGLEWEWSVVEVEYAVVMWVAHATRDYVV